MYNNIIFLDIDGVLNSMSWYRRQKDTSLFVSRSWVTELDPKAVRLLEDFLFTDNSLHIVISSTWRILNTLEEIKSYFKSVSDTFPVDRFISVTSNSSRGHRGTEIAKWIKDHDFRGNYVIIDDDSDMLPHQPFVQTTHKEGMLPEHIELMKAFLNK